MVDSGSWAWVDEHSVQTALVRLLKVGNPLMDKRPLVHFHGMMEKMLAVAGHLKDVCVWMSVYVCCVAALVSRLSSL